MEYNGSTVGKNGNIIHFLLYSVSISPVQHYSTSNYDESMEVNASYSVESNNWINKAWAPYVNSSINASLDETVN